MHYPKEQIRNESHTDQEVMSSREQNPTYKKKSQNTTNPSQTSPSAFHTKDLCYQKILKNKHTYKSIYKKRTFSPFHNTHWHESNQAYTLQRIKNILYVGVNKREREKEQQEEKSTQKKYSQEIEREKQEERERERKALCFSIFLQGCCTSKTYYVLLFSPIRSKKETDFTQENIWCSKTNYTFYALHPISVKRNTYHHHHHFRNKSEKKNFFLLTTILSHRVLFYEHHHNKNINFQ